MGSKNMLWNALPNPGTGLKAGDKLAFGKFPKVIHARNQRK